MISGMMTTLAAGTFHHVYDANAFELPFGVSLPIPSLGFGFTKFMLLQLVAAVLVFLIFRGLSARIASGQVANGWFWNFWEMLLVYIRDEMVRPIIGNPDGHGHGHDDKKHDVKAEHAGHVHSVAEHMPNEAAALHLAPHSIVASHPADRFLPFIWSCFFYILFINLLGVVPNVGAATGSLSVTAALAVVAFGATYYHGVKKNGPIGFWTHLVPSIDAPPGLKQILIVLLFVIEVIGLFIKHIVLSIRLFANVMGGHTGLAAILGFIAVAFNNNLGTGLYGMVLAGSLVGQIGVGLLELLVAFIQAYVFAFLSTIFIAMSIHEH